MGMAGFTEAELKVLALRVNGWKPAEIAKHFGWKRHCAHKYMWRVHVKTGINELWALREWARRWGLDELPTGAEKEPQPFGRRRKRTVAVCPIKGDLLYAWTRAASAQTQALREIAGKRMRDSRALDALLICQRAANAYTGHRDQHRC
jgi:hypothetical protein